MLPLLVLDLDETLLHSTTSTPEAGCDFDNGAYHTRLRPHLREFLEKVDPHYRVAIYTAAGLFYALDMIKGIRRATRYPFEPDTILDYRHCTHEGDLLLKDLTHLEARGHDLRRAVALDDKPQGYALHPHNVLPAPAWTGDPDDTFLKDVTPTLLALAKAEDVTRLIPELRQRTT